MGLKIPQLIHQYKFWFYVRKAIFQGFIPLLIGIITFYDLANNIESGLGTNLYAQLYVYTSLILFLYGTTGTVLNFIFDLCSDDIIFRKDIDLEQTVPNIMLSMHLDSQTSDSFIIIVKKIFKLRFSNSWFFISITKLCWWLGMDCPTLIPYELVKDFMHGDIKLSMKNERHIMHSALDLLYKFHPVKNESEIPQNPIIPLRQTSYVRPSANARLDESVDQPYNLMPNDTVRHVSDTEKSILHAQKIVYENFLGDSQSPEEFEV